MDIKIRFTKKGGIILGALVICGLISLGCWNVSTLKARHDIKATCQNNCGCFNNIVDHRLTKKQVRLFARFIKELQVRKDANVLEFMDTADAVSIQRAFAVCQPRIEPTPTPKQSEPRQVEQSGQAASTKTNRK